MRYLYILFFCLNTQVILSAQPLELSGKDISEIRFEAKKTIESHLNDLLNTITYSKASSSTKKKMILDSYMQSQEQIFFSGSIPVEDDIDPDNTIKGSGPGLPVSTYLDNLSLFYKGEDSNIQITEVSVGEVQQKGYPYVLVKFKSYFLKTNKQKPTTRYRAVYRVAELRADKFDKEWIVLITGIRYYKAPATSIPGSGLTSGVILPNSSGQVPKAVLAKTENSKEIKAAPTSLAKPEIAKEPVEVNNKPATKITAVKPEAEQHKIAAVDDPKKDAVIAAEKTPVPINNSGAVKAVADNPPPAASIKKEQPVKAEQKSKEIVPAPKTLPASTLSYAEMQDQIKRINVQSSRLKMVGLTAMAGGAAFLVVLNLSFNKYKKKVAATNESYTTWYTENMNRTTLDPGHIPIQQHSFPKYSAPGIYVAGAGILGGGIIWLIGNGKSHEAKSLKKQMNANKRLSILPEISGFDRYAGMNLTYKF